MNELKHKQQNKTTGDNHVSDQSEFQNSTLMLKDPQKQSACQASLMLEGCI